MLERMLAAEVGDDVFEEDPTVQQLQQTVCELTGHEAALFCASGTMSNQLGIRSNLGAPPHSVVCDHRAHVYVNEASAIAFFNGANVFPARADPAVGHITVDNVASACYLDTNIHHAPTKLVCLENTLNGEVMPLDEIRKISEFAHSNGIKMHLDGARLWNASVATGTPLKEYCKHFDTVSLCLSKGLGAPVGSILVGSRDLIAKAKHYRKMFGGGWRQAGILAAAALYAIEHHWPQMARDHEHAQLLAAGLERLGFRLTARCDTNMVWADTTPVGVRIDDLRDELARHGIRIFGAGGTGALRLVLHHQVSRESVEKFLEVTEAVVTKARGGAAAS
ncbi:Threonine aldolase [Cladochytrium tenue]|nr:Threonine aldolase [Cladochytrium tenue]